MDKQENHTISEKALEIVNKNPMSLGVLKTIDAKDNFDFSFLEVNRGMWLHTYKYEGDSPRREIFIFYDLTYDQSKLIRDKFEYSKFIPYESFLDSNVTPTAQKNHKLHLDFIENIRKRKLDPVVNTFSFNEDPKWEPIIK
jgi:hypothetical protein